MLLLECFCFFLDHFLLCRHLLLLGSRLRYLGCRQFQIFSSSVRREQVSRRDTCRRIYRTRHKRASWHRCRPQYLAGRLWRMRSSAREEHCAVWALCMLHCFHIGVRDGQAAEFGYSVAPARCEFHGTWNFEQVAAEAAVGQMSRAVLDVLDVHDVNYHHRCRWPAHSDTPDGSAVKSSKSHMEETGALRKAVLWLRRLYRAVKSFTHHLKHW